MWTPAKEHLEDLNRNRARFGLSTFTMTDFERSTDGRSMMTEAMSEIDIASIQADAIRKKKEEKSEEEIKESLTGCLTCFVSAVSVAMLAGFQSLIFLPVKQSIGISGTMFILTLMFQKIFSKNKEQK